mmetsp:Transcript_62/g.164  ORF Transcript_62/g.164 Transcript_62/m.164 type:complete len:209 (+) Transcript_62:753-1379(+)
MRRCSRWSRMRCAPRPNTQLHTTSRCSPCMSQLRSPTKRCACSSRIAAAASRAARQSGCCLGIAAHRRRCRTRPSWKSPVGTLRFQGRTARSLASAWACRTHVRRSSTLAATSRCSLYRGSGRPRASICRVTPTRQSRRSQSIHRGGTIWHKGEAARILSPARCGPQSSNCLHLIICERECATGLPTRGGRATPLTVATVVMHNVKHM